MKKKTVSYHTSTMLAWAKVVIEKFVFKGKDKVMAEKIQPH